MLLSAGEVALQTKTVPGQSDEKGWFCGRHRTRPSQSCLFLMKSRMSYFVLWTFRVRLLSEHQSEIFSNSALYAVSSSLLMSPTMVELSAYFITQLVGWVGEQSWVYRAYSKGLRTQPWGEPVLSMSVEE